jgi:peptide/nickel transport system ATP-binding protein
MLLSVEGLQVAFGDVGVVRGVTLSLEAGETLGLVGETGCGKSVMALTIMGLIPQARIEGTLTFDGLDLRALSPRQWEDVRGRRIGMVFQDPFTALNPVFTIGDQVSAVLARHFGLKGAGLRDRMLGWLGRVGLPPTADFAARYPHLLSGGQRQRVAIALALAGEPTLLLADEPTTALDVTVQAQILDLLRTLQRQTGVAVVFISHDLDVIGSLCHRVAVMYAGRIVEQGETTALFAGPRHPYTRGLFEARQPHDGRLPAIPGSVPPPSAFPQGCAFHPRCGRMQQRCTEEVPELGPATPTQAACFYPF